MNRLRPTRPGGSIGTGRCCWTKRKRNRPGCPPSARSSSCPCRPLPSPPLPPNLAVLLTVEVELYQWIAVLSSGLNVISINNLIEARGISRTECLPLVKAVMSRRLCFCFSHSNLSQCLECSQTTSPSCDYVIIHFPDTPLITPMAA